jgi:hypothetical protein
MKEKVIFEYRSDDEGLGFQMQCSQEFREFLPHSWEFHHPAYTPRVIRKRISKWNQQRKKKLRQHMRETLDFFEDIYTDLYDDKRFE